MFNLSGKPGNICYDLSGGYKYFHSSTRDRHYHEYMIVDNQGVIATFKSHLVVLDELRYKQFQARHKPYPFDGGATFAD